MNKRSLIGLACIALCFVVFFTLRSGSHKVEPIIGAYVHLPFENTLKDYGSANLEGQSHDGRTYFAAGQTGKSLHTQGDGSWVEYRAGSNNELSDLVEISFDFKPEGATALNKKGSSIRTMATVSGKGEKRIVHITFSLSPGDKSTLSVAFSGHRKKMERLYTPLGAVTTDWHKATLKIYRTTSETALYLDGKLISSIDVAPVLMEGGFDRIRLGTWHKTNQVYRGLIDNFVIRDGSVELENPQS